MRAEITSDGVSDSTSNHPILVGSRPFCTHPGGQADERCWESARLLAEAQSEQYRILSVRRPHGLQALPGRASKESHEAYGYRFLHPVVEDATCRDGGIELNPKGKIGPITPSGRGAGRDKVLGTLDALT